MTVKDENRRTSRLIQLTYILLAGLLIAFLVNIHILLAALSLALLLGLLVVKIYFNHPEELFVVSFIIVAVFFPQIALWPQLPELRPEDFLLLAALYLLLLSAIRHQSLAWRWGVADLVFLGLLTSIIISMVYGQYLGVKVLLRDWFELFKIIKYYLIFRIFSLLTPGKILPLVHRIFPYLAIALGLFALMQFFNIFNINSWLTPIFTTEVHLKNIVNREIGLRRIPGTTGNPNDFAMLALIFFIYLFNLVIKNKVSFIIYAGLAAVSVAIILTQSRTVLIALLLALGYLLFVVHHFQLSKRNSFLMLLLLFSFPVILGYLYSTGIFSYMNQLQEGTAVESLQMRFQIWVDTWVQIKESWILGWGPGKEIHATYVDNEYLLQWRRYGLVGLAGLLGLYGIIWVTARRAASRTKGIAQSMAQSMEVLVVALVVVNTMNSTFYQLQLFPFIMALWGLVDGQNTFPPLKQHRET